LLDQGRSPGRYLMLVASGSLTG